MEFKDDDLYEFVEPHTSGGDCIIRLTARQAIEWCRPKYKDIKCTDEIILQDFITVNWAVKVQDKAT